MMHVTLPLCLLLATCLGQQIGTTEPEQHPILTTQKCTVSGGCVTQNTKVVLDQNYRYLHVANPTSSAQNCYLDNQTWNTNYCTDPATCAKVCQLDGVNSTNYFEKYGIQTTGNKLTQLYFQKGNIGSRVYLMADDSHYQLLSLKGQEISFDVDVSGLPCGTIGALYLVNMFADGGHGQYPANAAGATYGTGYCDAQCDRHPKFINGQANLLGWSNTQGSYGSCCAEIDLWEANAASTAMTAHTCSQLGPYRCSSATADCGPAGICDQGGCDFNPYRMGNTSFYGSSGTISTQPGKMRVITKFKTVDGTKNSDLHSIERIYIRNGKIIFNSNSDVKNVPGNALTDAYCTAENTAFGGPGTFAGRGGMHSMSAAMDLGMVLAFSTYYDYAYDVHWLDSQFPAGASTGTPGVVRGPCGTATQSVDSLRAQYPNAQVQFSNVKWGDMDTTYGPPYP